MADEKKIVEVPVTPDGTRILSDEKWIRNCGLCGHPEYESRAHHSMLCLRFQQLEKRVEEQDERVRTLERQMRRLQDE